MKTCLIPIALLMVACSGSKSPADVTAADRERATDELADATQVVGEMHQIPQRYRKQARCVVVVPSLVRAGLVIGARHGSGVVSCRTTAGWSAPAFVTISGGSAGLQAGVESSDLVMLVMSERGKSQLLRSSFAIGADISACAGPDGEAKQAA